MFAKSRDDSSILEASNNPVTCVVRSICPAILARSSVDSRSVISMFVAKSFGLWEEVKPYMKAKVNMKVFQALRIAVNDELNNLREVLPAAQSLLAPKGRLAVISFHSLEDRIVKWQFVDFEKMGHGTIITKHPVMAMGEEIDANSRSASAKLRIFENN